MLDTNFRGYLKEKSHFPGCTLQNPQKDWGGLLLVSVKLDLRSQFVDVAGAHAECDGVQCCWCRALKHMETF